MAQIVHTFPATDVANVFTAKESFYQVNGEFFVGPDVYPTIASAMLAARASTLIRCKIVILTGAVNVEDISTVAGLVNVLIEDRRTTVPSWYQWNGTAYASVAVATVDVGTVTTLPPGSQAHVVNSGTREAAILNFSLPAGPASVSIGSVTTLAPGSQATVTDTGTAGAAVLNLGIPQGSAGEVSKVLLGQSQYSSLKSIQSYLGIVGSSVLVPGDYQTGGLNRYTGAYDGTQGGFVTNYIPVVPQVTAGTAGQFSNYRTGSYVGSNSTCFYGPDFAFISAVSAGHVEANTVMLTPTGAAWMRVVYDGNDSGQVPSDFGVFPNGASGTLKWGLAGFSVQDTINSKLLTLPNFSDVVVSSADVVSSLENTLGLAPRNLFRLSDFVQNIAPISGTGVLESTGIYNIGYIEVPIFGRHWVTSLPVETRVHSQNGSDYYAPVYLDARGRYVGSVPTNIGYASGYVFIPPATASHVRIPFFYSDVSNLSVGVYVGDSLPTVNSTFLKPIPTAQTLSSWYGLRGAFLTDSLLKVDATTGVNTAQAIANRLGCASVYLDLLNGRKQMDLFNNYNGRVASSVYQGTSSAGFCNAATGSTLGQNIGTCDFVAIECFGNDTNAAVWGDNRNDVAGTLVAGSSPSVMTLAGATRLNIESILAINPKAKIFLITFYQIPAGLSSGGVPYFPVAGKGPVEQAAFLTPIANDYGASVISMVDMGISPPRGGSPGNFVDGSGNPLFGNSNVDPHLSKLGALTCLVPGISRKMNLYGPA